MNVKTIKQTESATISTSLSRGLEIAEAVAMLGWKQRGQTRYMLGSNERVDLHNVCTSGSIDVVDTGVETVLITEPGEEFPREVTR